MGEMEATVSHDQPANCRSDLTEGQEDDPPNKEEREAQCADQDRRVEEERITDQKLSKEAERQRLEEETLADEARIVSERRLEEEMAERRHLMEEDRFAEKARISEQQRVQEEVEQQLQAELEESQRRKKDRDAEVKTAELKRLQEAEVEHQRIENDRFAEQLRLEENGTERLAEETRLAEEPKANTIVEEAEECLAQSLLMFLYADLRLLSATGRINTKFEALCIDSDRVPRTSAAELAQLPEIDNLLDHNCRGVSPAQIMAVLIVELRQEVLAQRRRAKELIKKRENRGWGMGLLDDEDEESDDEDDDAGVMNKITDKKGRKEFETDMHGLIRSYNDMLAKDLKGIPEVKMFTNPFKGWTQKNEDAGVNSSSSTSRVRAWTRSIMKSRLGSFDESDQIELMQAVGSQDDMDQPDIAKKSTPPLTASKQRSFRKNAVLEPLAEAKCEDVDDDDDPTDAISESEMITDENVGNKKDVQNSARLTSSKLFEILESFRGPKSPQHHDIDSSSIKSDPGPNGWDGENSDHTPWASNMLQNIDEGQTQRQAPRMLTRRVSQVSQYIERTREDHAMYNKVIIPAEDYETFTTAENVGNVLFRETNLKLPLAACPESSEMSQDTGRNMSENELLDFMTKCIESGKDDRLDFMKDFFKDDSISQIMVKSNARVVWLQDWYPIKDCIYAITVDKKKKRVLVVFRGAITRPDWNHSFDNALKKSHNPVKENYDGRANFIRIHRGFYTYLFRQRKDTLTRKYDEIANKVNEYGEKMIGRDFTVCVNGYSLGGALAALFGFYASTEERFIRNGPVKVFTYGMPYAFSHSFADAFRHQEKSKKLQHARFYNHNDLVAHLPFNTKATKRGANFVHVGIDVKMFPPVGDASFWGSRPPRIRYNRRESAMSSYWRAIKLNSLLNCPLPWKIRSKHGLPELQKRLTRACVISGQTKNPMLHKTLDEAYEMLVYSKC